jgi:O-methyltransferase
MNRLLVSAFRQVQRLSFERGFDIRYFSPAKNMPDAELYGPTLQPWRSAEWQRRLRADDPVSFVTPDRKYVLWQLAEQAAKTVDGAFFECGVNAGGTAYLLAQILHGTGKPLHLFDTFSGMPPVDPSKDLHAPGDFADASLAGVQRYLAAFENLDYHPGLIPETFVGLEPGPIAFAHLDLDIYKSTRDATEFVYPRLAKGGFLLYDDYGFPTCPGARQAVDEFFAGRPENVLALGTGQALVVRA